MAAQLPTRPIYRKASDDFGDDIPVANAKGKRASGKDAAHLDRIRELPCIICHLFGEPQLSATQAHHCIHGRFSFAKASDYEAIPLCEGHHQGLWDTSKIALHQGKKTWADKYGPDFSYLDDLKAIWPEIFKGITIGAPDLVDARPGVDYREIDAEGKT